MRTRYLMGILVLLIVGFVQAADYTGKITKIADGKITIKVVDKDKKTNEKTFKVANKLFCGVQEKKGGKEEQITFAEAIELIKKSKDGVKGLITVIGEDDSAEMRTLLLYIGKKE